VAQGTHRIRGALVIVGAPALVDSGLQIEQRLPAAMTWPPRRPLLPASSDASNSCCIRCAARIPFLPDDPTLP
jgi:two-component system capsular synthesis sensor histidine kinase RcsC